jgi:hypothetical protein
MRLTTDGMSGKRLGMQSASRGMRLTTDGMSGKRLGMQSASRGMQLTSDGMSGKNLRMQLTSDGMSGKKHFFQSENPISPVKNTNFDNNLKINYQNTLAFEH